MVASLAAAEINYSRYLNNKEADIFLWLEFTCDIDSKWVDYWIDHWEKWMSQYYDNAIQHIGLITNIGLREPYQQRWGRVRRIMVENTMQALLKYHEINNHPINLQGFSNNGRMLFLTGKPLSVNRMPVLDLIDRGPLQERTTASLFWNDSLYHLVEQCGIESDRARLLVNKYLGSPDNLHVDSRSIDGHFHSAGLPYNTDMYANHQLCLIPETTVGISYTHNYCTEKTYRTILNRMPFVILGQPGTIEHLHDRGYRTFVDYMPYPDYNSLDISTVDKLRQHWPMIQENCLALLGQQHVQGLRQDCEHNYHRLLEENKIMLDRVTQASDSQIIYDLESYNKFNWGPQPPGFRWPIPLPGNN